MIRAIVVSLVALTSTTANAQTCVYKSAMTDAEIEACKHSQPSSASAKQIPQAAKSNFDAEQYLAKRRAMAQARREAEAASPKEPYIGMTDSEAWAINDGPFNHVFRDKVNVTETGRGRSEQWVYENSLTHRYGYLYFVNGKLTSIQRSD